MGLYGISLDGLAAPLAAPGPSYQPSTLQHTQVRPGLVAIAPKPTSGDGVDVGSENTSHMQPAASSTASGIEPGQSTVPASAQQTKSANSTSRQRRGLGNGTKRRKKRRRTDDDDENIIKAGDTSSDESDGLTATATQTKSGRQVHRPALYVPPATSPPSIKPANVVADVHGSSDAQTHSARKRRRVYRKGKEMNVNCMRCQRGHSPSTNAIVFCDECNRAWHQLCHDPYIDDEVVAVKEKEWLCYECTPQTRATSGVAALGSTSINGSEALVIPKSAVSVSVPVMEVGAEVFSAEERRSYLSGLSHASLVELLVSLSEKNTTLPMFPSNLREMQLSKFAFQPSVVQPPESMVDTSAATPMANGCTLENSKNGPTDQVEESNSTSRPEKFSPDPSRRKRRHFESDDESEYEEFLEHRLYPRVGNGFRLPFDPEDLDILADDPACPTFSYSLHGAAKVRAEAKQSAPVWASAY